jgi:hypothetical protein
MAGRRWPEELWAGILFIMTVQFQNGFDSKRRLGK